MRYTHNEVLIMSTNYGLRDKLLQCASFYFGAAAPATSYGDEDTSNTDHPERDSRDECKRTESEPA